MRKEVTLELKYGKAKIAFFGSGTEVDKSLNELNNITLTGKEGDDRLVIQEAIDDGRIKADVMYDGNTVVGYNKLAKELMRFRKTGSIEKMTNAMYNFLTTGYDIAHYDKQGFIAYYNGSFREMCRGLDVNSPSWKTDVKELEKLLVP